MPGGSPWTEEPDGLNPWGRKESDMTKQLIPAQHTSVKEEVHGRAFATKVPLFTDKKNI